MSDKSRKLLDALRAHLDLDGAPEEVTEQWNAATDDERKGLLDRLLLETLLVDTLVKAGPNRLPQSGEARPSVPRRALPLLKMLAAAAALIAVVGMGIYLSRCSAGYPQPEVAGDFNVRSPSGQRVTRGAPQRGQRIVAGAGGARLSLGGYCDLVLAPGAVLVLQGEPRKEVVHLEEGKLVSRISHEKGAFTVLTPRGTLDVVGTEFETTVMYRLVKGENVMNRSRKSAIVTVAVVSGLVAYHFGDATGVLSGGARQAFGAEDGAAVKPDVKQIAAGKPTYRAKNHRAWREKGRIVGRMRQCPGCKVEARDAKGKVVKSCSAKAKAGAYELEWLKPGKYTLRVTAKGYDTLVLKDLAVKAKNDLFVNLEF